MTRPGRVTPLRAHPPLRARADLASFPPPCLRGGGKDPAAASPLARLSRALMQDRSAAEDSTSPASGLRASGWTTHIVIAAPRRPGRGTTAPGGLQRRRQQARDGEGVEEDQLVADF